MKGNSNIKTKAEFGEFLNEFQMEIFEHHWLINKHRKSYMIYFPGNNIMNRYIFLYKNFSISNSSPRISIRSVTHMV